MIITISGNPGSGKSTAAKFVVEKLGAERIYAGGIMRSMSKEKGMDFNQFLEYIIDHPEIDIEVDERTRDEARKLSEQGKTVIVEGRMQFHFIPESLKIFVKVDSGVGARRIFKAMQNKVEAEERNEAAVTSVEEMKQKVEQRYNGDAKRYIDIYKLDYREESNYDEIIDATNMNLEEEGLAVLDVVKKHL
jgi:CMP/dCMP kinase